MSKAQDNSIRWLVQAMLGIYGGLTLFMLLIPFQDFDIKLLQMHKIEFNSARIGWFQYVISSLATFLVIAFLTFMPKLHRRFHEPSQRGGQSIIFFWVIGILSFLISSTPPGFSYHGATLALIILFGALIGLVYDSYSAPPVPDSLLEPYSLSHEWLHYRWDLIKSEQDRWWKYAQMFIPVSVILMVTVGIGWASFPLPSSFVVGNNEDDFRALRLTQIALVELFAVIGFIAVVINIWVRINEMHKLLEKDYKGLNGLHNKTTGNAHVEGKEEHEAK